jgi:hypothetical protein
MITRGRILKTGLALLLVLAAASWATPPVFENRTPVGFAPQDSATVEDFALGQTISVRVDLNQAATPEYPVVAHFHAVERSVQVGTVGTDGMRVDIAMAPVAPFGVQADTGSTPAVHMAWIQEQGLSQGPIYNGGITPVYQVMYARSSDGGATFGTPVSVSGDLSYHPITADGGGGAFSTLDLEIDSGGRPRIVYAMVPTANRQRQNNVYFTYSEDGGSTWQTPIRANNLSQAEGIAAAFPDMVIDDRDNVYISYVRGSSAGAGADDVMLSKVNRGTSPFSMVPVGESGSAGSGGVRLTPDGERHTGPALGVGDGDALHAIYFNDTDNRIEHRRLGTDTTWVETGSGGWDQDVDGATVAAFDNSAATNAALEKDAIYYFPNLALDRRRLPDRIYAVYKFGDNTPNEGVYFNYFDDAGPVGTAAVWQSASPVWAGLFADGVGAYNIELDWKITEKVAAVVDTRLEERGDLHVAFSAGYSGGMEHDLYYARYNGTDWTLPEKVADDDSDVATQDGIAATDVFLAAPRLAWHPSSEHLYLSYVGGTAEGFGVDGVNDADHHAYFKVLARATSFEDRSIPVGAFQYTLSHTPVNPQDALAEITNNPIYVHAADPVAAGGLGADGTSADGFLSGDWETVGAALADNDKFFDGEIDEDFASDNEWGDDGDKVGLLAKLNVLGSDSATNLQVITSSTASAAGTGVGARSVRVGIDPSGSFVGAGSFFMLGADIDIVAGNAAPTVALIDPDGVGDGAAVSYDIRYDLSDADDDLDGGLQAAFYVYAGNGLQSVRDIRIFATLIADENDRSANNVAGTDDLSEGTNQTYTWDDPPTPLQSGALFASIDKVSSGDYYVYLVADDGKNAPVFAVSSGSISLRHAPIVRQVDPVAADTVDSGIRQGLKAPPYDLDYTVVDHDGEARLQLFYSSVSGLSSVSVAGQWPDQTFVLGKSLAGTRANAITASASLGSRSHEYAWDPSQPLVAEGDYYIYVVASDSALVTVGQSAQTLAVRHSPSFAFYEPPVDTRRRIDSGDQPVYAIQWQKGPGDTDLDDDASIALYFSGDDPAVVDHSTAAGAASTSLTLDADTGLIVSGLGEDSDGPADIYEWDLRAPPNDIPRHGQRVWIYAVIDDGVNRVVVRGGALDFEHDPHILLKTRLPEIGQGDVLRLEWDDYLVDDGSGTDDAYVRLYAASVAGLDDLGSLENAVAAGSAYIVNSSDGTAAGTLSSLRESDTAFMWDTQSDTFTLPEGNYWVYAGISADASFNASGRSRVSVSANRLSVATGTGTSPNMGLSPSRLFASAGDTLDFEVRLQSGGAAANGVSVVIGLESGFFEVVNAAAPFTDSGLVLPGGTVSENTSTATQLRFAKSQLGGQVAGTELEPLLLASFSLVAKSGFSGVRRLAFDDEAAISIAGSALPLTKSSGMAVRQAEIRSLARARIEAAALLEGRAAPLGNGDHSTLLDIHLRRPGALVDIADALYRSTNDAVPATPDTVEVQSGSSGRFSLVDIPSGRYVLTVKDSSHLSGRTDTLVLRQGEVLTLGATQGFFASDVRGDPSFLLGNNGRLLRGGDVTGDNEIDEDDVNAIDAAWGTDSGAPRFAQADINNDSRVDIGDLSLVASNIGNSFGFGAPPVFKAIKGGEGEVRAVWSPLDYSGQWQQGEEIELLLLAEGLDDLAAYELALSYEQGEMELVELSGVGEVFRANAVGFSRRADIGEGQVQVAAARFGRAWSASGAGQLLRLKIRLQRNGYPASLRVESGQLLNSAYERSDLGPDAPAVLPRHLVLEANYPNPFNPSTAIPFVVPGAAKGAVVVEVYNTAGQKVKTLLRRDLGPGRYTAHWDGTDMAERAVGSGVYFYQVRSGGERRVGRMTLLK